MTTAERLVKLTQSLPEQIQMEVLDFAEFLNQRCQSTKTIWDSKNRPLSDLIGGLEKSQVFHDLPEVIQQKIRNDWD
jgi:hypothetical protein